MSGMFQENEEAEHIPKFPPRRHRCPCNTNLDKPTKLHKGVVKVLMFTDPPIVEADWNVFSECREGLLFNIKALVEIARDIQNVITGRLVTILKGYHDELGIFLNSSEREVDRARIDRLLLKEGFMDFYVEVTPLEVVDREIVMQALTET